MKLLEYLKIKKSKKFELINGSNGQYISYTNEDDSISTILIDKNS